MRVDVTSSSRELFGSDRSAVHVAKLVQDLGHEARLLVPARRPERGLSDLALAEGVPVLAADIAVASSAGLGGVRAVVRTRGEPADLAIANTSAVIACSQPARRRMLVVREWLNHRDPRHRALASLHARRVSAVVAVSSGVADRWGECAPHRCPARVAPDWLDDAWLERSGARNGVASGDREGILFLGRFNGWKGAEALAEAYELAFGDAADRPSLTLVGAEPEGSPHHARAASLERSARRGGFRVLPFTPEPELLVRRAQLVVVPSMRPEPFGYVLLESLALGARVMAFPGGGPDDMAANFPGTIELVPRWTRSLADALAAWWANGGGGQTDEQHARSLATIEERYSERSAARAWRELLASVED